MSSVKEIDRAFEAKLAKFSPQTASSTTFNLGKPSRKLLAAGVENKEIRLYGNKLLKKINKHGFNTRELRGLTKATRNPIAVFQTQNDGSYAVLTTLRASNGNFLVVLNVGKGQDANYLMVLSVYEKGDEKVVNWINNNMMRYVDKKKALKYLHSVTPFVTASDVQELKTAANIVSNFQNGKYSSNNSQNLAEKLRKVLGSAK